MNINIIVAYCNNRGIGLNNQLPWHFPQDLKKFSKITKGNGNNAIIMGRKTFESIGKVLPGRFNIVLSKNYNYKNVDCYSNIEDALNICNLQKFDEVFIIGGSQIYEEVLKKKLIHKIYATEINCDFECDTFFPLINNFILENYEKDVNNENISYKIFKLL